MTATETIPQIIPSIQLNKAIFFGVFPFQCIILGCTYSTEWFKLTTICVIVATLGFYTVYNVIPTFAIMLRKKGICGKDLNKITNNAERDPILPESLGLIAGSVFILCALGCQTLFSDDPSKLLEYSSGLLSVCCMTLLGFADDVIDLRWRYKMTLPFAASLPLVLMYRGPTVILIPPILRSYFGKDGLLDLGICIYRIYMILLTVFCTNSINIYAEVGQSLVICGAVIIHNLLELLHFQEVTNELQTSHHLFSLLFSLPFFATSLGLFSYNWFPAAVFVGDSYTCFSGVYFAVVGILGHFSKTLLFFFIPQIFNFILSFPQLTGIIPCPRHRIPQLNQKTGKLEYSGNFTLINLVLKIFGPMREDRLCFFLLVFQVICCIAGLYVRHEILAYWGET